MTALPIPPCPDCQGTVWELDVEVAGTIMVDAADPTDGPELLLELVSTMPPLCCASCGAEATIQAVSWSQESLWDLPDLKVILQKLTKD